MAIPLLEDEFLNSWSLQRGVPESNGLTGTF
jgi:hypothetical protein